MTGARATRWHRGIAFDDRTSIDESKSNWRKRRAGLFLDDRQSHHRQAAPALDKRET
jgi:hypothetical protein